MHYKEHLEHKLALYHLHACQTVSVSAIRVLTSFSLSDQSWQPAIYQKAAWCALISVHHSPLCMWLSSNCISFAQSDLFEIMRLWRCLANRESSCIIPPLVETCVQCIRFKVSKCVTVCSMYMYIIFSWFIVNKSSFWVNLWQLNISIPLYRHAHFTAITLMPTFSVCLHHFVEQRPLQWGALPYFPMPRHELAHTLQPTDVLHLALSVFSAFYQLCHTELLVCSRHVGITVIVSCWVVILTTHAFD